MKNVKQYYKELGQLVYAIAIADGVIQPEERYELHQFVTKELAHREKTHDSSGMNHAFYVDFEFEDLEKRHPAPNGEVRAFNDFLEANLEPGDEELLRLSLDLMESVASAYSKSREKSIIEQVRRVANTFLSK